MHLEAQIAVLASQIGCHIIVVGIRRRRWFYLLDLFKGMLRGMLVIGERAKFVARLAQVDLFTHAALVACASDRIHTTIIALSLP